MAGWGDPMSYSDVEMARQELRKPNKFVCIPCRAQAKTEAEIAHVGGCPASKTKEAK